jgi:hypothetical protein
MNTKIFFLLLVFFVLSCKDNSNAKKVKTSENLTVKTNSIKQSPKESLEVATKKDTLDPRIKPFIENGMEVLAIETGDLNLDGIEDKLLATQNIVLADSVQEPDFRKLAILIGQKNNTFKLVASNEKCLYTTDMSGMSMTDPFSGLAIKNGYFSIESEVAGGQHWSQIITFKYNKSKNNWFLYKVHFISYELNDNGELALQTDTTTTVKNFGEISFEKYNLIEN